MSAKVRLFLSGLSLRGLIRTFDLNYLVLNFGNWAVYKQDTTKTVEVDADLPLKSIIPAWEYRRFLKNVHGKSRIAPSKNKDVLSFFSSLNKSLVDDVAYPENF